MKVNDKEFYELREQFEKAHIKRSLRHRLDHDTDGHKGIFYEDGTTNELFYMYMMGYENAKCLSRIGSLD